MAQIQKGIIGRLGLQKHYHESKPLFRRYLPHIAWLEKIYMYKNEQNRNCFIELSHAATGITIKNILKSESLEKIRHCGDCVGRALSSFQQVFIKYVDKNNPLTWSTVQHGDFHGSNIVFDASREVVYFIDHATMSEGYSIFKDAIYLIELIGGIRFTDVSYFKNIDFTYSFFKGYVNAYSQDKQCGIATILAQRVLDSLGSIIVRFTVNSCLTDMNDKNIDVYRYFMIQQVAFLKLYVMKFGAHSMAHGVSGINAAMYQGNDEQVKQLLHVGEDVNKSDVFGMTPLFWALEKKDANLLLLLKDHNVHFEETTILFPHGILEYFILTDDQEALKIFIDVMNPSQDFMEEQLFKATLYGSVGTINLLLNLGVNVNARYKEPGPYVFTTPLHFAVRKMHDSVVQELLKVPALNLNLLDISGRTPLLFLVETIMNISKNDMDKAHFIAKRLLEAGADGTLQNKEEKTAFDFFPEWIMYKKL